MTACIVGWAHTPFGKLGRGDRREPDRPRHERGARNAGRRAPRTWTRSCSGISTRGFSAQEFTASLVLQAEPDFRFKPATRVENACATGSAAVHQALKSDRGEARPSMVLVVGVEQMTTTPGPEIGKNLLKASYLPEEGDTPGGFAGVFGKIAGALFPAPRRPVRRAGDDRGEEPQERRRQPLCADAQGSRLRVLPAREREEPLRRRVR